MPARIPKCGGCGVCGEGEVRVAAGGLLSHTLQILNSFHDTHISGQQETWRITLFAANELLVSDEMFRLVMDA